MLVRTLGERVFMVQRAPRVAGTNFEHLNYAQNVPNEPRTYFEYLNTTKYAQNASISKKYFFEKK